MASMPIEVFSPIRMMDPLPNCLSMAANATSSAFSRSLLTVVLRFLPDACGVLLGVEAELHDPDCYDGHHTEGVLHGSPGMALFEQQQCNYEQSFDQALPRGTATAASVNSAASGRWTARSRANQIVNVNG